ncbi:MAG: hypothetical protein ACLPX7_07720 [Xanthobacteraceae bacterium]
MLSTATVIPFVLFVALILAASLHGLAASGHFPRAPRPSTSKVGPIILFGSMAVAIAGLASGIVAAVRFVPWYAAIIGGGLSILAAPLVLQRFPDRFVDSRGALLTFAAANVALAIVLIALT